MLRFACTRIMYPVFPDILNVAVVRVHVYLRNVPHSILCSPSFLKAAKVEKCEAALCARQAALLAAQQGVRRDPKGPPLLTQPQKADEA